MSARRRITRAGAWDSVKNPSQGFGQRFDIRKRLLSSMLASSNLVHIAMAPRA
jgi:hypothetical protein